MFLSLRLHMSSRVCFNQNFEFMFTGLNIFPHRDSVLE